MEYEVNMNRIVHIDNKIKVVWYVKTIPTKLIITWILVFF